MTTTIDQIMAADFYFCPQANKVRQALVLADQGDGAQARSMASRLGQSLNAVDRYTLIDRVDALLKEKK